MTLREKTAWIVAASALGLFAYQHFAAPDWVVLNSEMGVVRMDRRTGDTERLGGKQWRKIAPPNEFVLTTAEILALTTQQPAPQVATPTEPFDPDKYLGENPAPSASAAPAHK